MQGKTKIRATFEKNYYSLQTQNESYLYNLTQCRT